MGFFMDFFYRVKKISERCTGDEYLVYTPFYKFEYPHSHRVKGGLLIGDGQIRGLLFLRPDSDDKHLVWPVKLEFKLLAYMKGNTNVLGTRMMIWDANAKDSFEDISRRNSITVSLQDLKTKYNMIGADDSVTFYWSVKLSYPQPQDLQSAANSDVVASQKDTRETMKIESNTNLAINQKHNSDSEFRAGGLLEVDAQIHGVAQSKTEVLELKNTNEQPQEEECDEKREEYEYDFLLVGKPGAGKSALGNSILQRRGVFGKQHSLTSGCGKMVYSRIEDKQLRVLEVPGFLGQSQNKEELSLFKEGSMKRTVDIINGIIESDPEAFHVVLYVVRYGPELTKEEGDMVKLLKSRFGESFFQDYCILVMTCGDFFEKSHGSFRQWCNKQKEGKGDLGKLISEVEDRVVLFNNKTKDKKKLVQVKQLLHMAGNLKQKKAEFTASGFT